MPNIVIIGSGMAGLSAAYHAQEKGLDYAVLEGQNQAGGLCRTVKEGGFYFDFSGHLLHLKNPYFKRLVTKLLAGNLNTLKRNSAVYSRGAFTPYPFQCNLYGLPAAVVGECVSEFIKSYYTYRDMPAASYKTFYEWITAKFGKGIGRHFMFGYNEKFWSYSLHKITCEWIKDYIPRPDLKDVLKGAFYRQKNDFGYNVVFQYPKRGGIQALCGVFAGNIKNLRLNSEVKKVLFGKNEIELRSGERIKYNKLISTMPLKSLVRSLEGPVPGPVKIAGGRLKHNSVIILNIAAKANGFMGSRHWVYLPEKRYAPYRIGCYSNFSKYVAPPETVSYYAEVSYLKGQNINKAKLINKAAQDMIDIGFISKKKDILAQNILDVDCAYVIYDKDYHRSRKVIMDYINKRGIYSIGRYGNWEYSSMEDALRQGREAVNGVAGLL